MVRNYIRKRKQTYFPEDLEKAVLKVKNKEMGFCKASSFYGVPRSTLFSRLHSRGSVTHGRPTLFPLSFEKNVAKVLQSMDRYGFNLRRKEITALVANYATRNNMKTPSKNYIPGHDWFSAFTKRHNLTLRKFQPDSTRSLDPFVIYGFFELLQNTIDRHNIQPNRIYYLIENTFSLNLTTDTVDIQPTIPYLTINSAEKEENISVLLAANACGDTIPPLIITKDTILWNHSLYGSSKVKQSRLNPCVFENYFENIVFPKLCTKKDPLLLIYDGRPTHLDIHVLRMAAKNNITVIKLPPNGKLSPLNTAVKDGIKDYMSKHLIFWKRDDTGEIGDDEVSCLITQTWEQMDPNIISEGFKTVGIWPVDPDVFPREIFDQTALTEWEQYAKNEDRVINEPFRVKEEVESGDETMDISMESNYDEFDSNNDKEDEISIGTDTEIIYEFKPSVAESTHIETTETSVVDDQRKCVGRNKSVDHSDPLLEATSFNGFADLTKAINNLCGELVSVRKEMSSFKQEFVKMTSMMATFNERVTNVERKLPS